MIKFIYVSGFKSLVDFKMDLSSFNCLVGLNGSGKSTVLQAFDFISSIHQGAVSSWLEARKWKMSELAFKGSRKQVLILQVGFELNGKTYIWSANFNRVRAYCTHESLIQINYGSSDGSTRLLDISEGKYRLYAGELKSVDFVYEGSILSRLKSDAVGKEITEISHFLSGIRSMDLLSPHLIRQKSRASSVSDIGLGGEKLSVFLHGLSLGQKEELVDNLRKYNPNITSISTSKIRGGMVKIEVNETFSNLGSISTEARHVNDGLIRLLAIDAQRYSENSFILYDEIENGVNPEVTQLLVNALLESPKQTLVTTHSPVVLNFLPDEIAKDSVTLIYKRSDGVSRAIKLFDIPLVSEKLDFLAPGEVVVDIPHAALAEEAEIILVAREKKE